MDQTIAKRGTSVATASNKNAIKHKPTPQKQAKQVIDLLEAFSVFITDDMLKTIVQNTKSNI